MANWRIYGDAPFKMVVVHGGPGVAGEMAPVARELAKTCGVLEPIQTALTVDTQVEELRQTIVQHAAAPVVVIGYSWGAWLSFILASRYRELVSKLILVSSGPFTPEYAFTTDKTRFSRLNTAERIAVQALKADLDNPAYSGDKNALMARVGDIFIRVDSYDPLPHENEAVCRWEIFSSIWPQAAALRQSGELLAFGRHINCPVTAIHGDYDPHPAEGVRVPLSGVLRDFKFILLEKCGHVPWFERQAQQRFYAELKQALE